MKFKFKRNENIVKSFSIIKCLYVCNNFLLYIKSTLKNIDFPAGDAGKVRPDILCTYGFIIH